MERSTCIRPKSNLLFTFILILTTKNCFCSLLFVSGEVALFSKDKQNCNCQNLTGVSLLLIIEYFRFCFVSNEWNIESNVLRSVQWRNYDPHCWGPREFRGHKFNFTGVNLQRAYERFTKSWLKKNYSPYLRNFSTNFERQFFIRI